MEFKVYVANLGKYNEGELVGEWIGLPASDDEINEMFVRIGLGRMDDDEYKHGLEVDGVVYEEYAIHDTDIDIEGLSVGEYSNIRELNKLAESLDALDDGELTKLQAAMSYFGYEASQIIDRLDDFTLYEDIHNDYDLGYYWAVETGCYEIDIDSHPLLRYIDYEAFGRDLAIEANGGFTSFGFIEEAR